MRSILVVAILLAGINGALSESGHQNYSNFQNYCSIVTASRFAAPAVAAASAGKAGRPPVWPISLQSSEAPHGQEEAALEPRMPAPASTDVNAGGGASVGALCHALLTSAKDNDLPVPFFANLIWQESRLDLFSVSRAGAQGIAQFMPKVAAEIGLRNPFDPHEALPASARFLQALRQHFGNLGFVAAAYNAGTHRVADWLDHGRSLPSETRTYVVRVTGRSADAWRKAPIDDLELTFVRPMPCRELPAFADLERAKLRSARALADKDQAQPEQAAADLRGPAAAKDETLVQKIVRKVASIAREIQKKAPPRRQAAVERKEVRRVARSGKADKMARNFHVGRHQETRHQSDARARRRVA